MKRGNEEQRGVPQDRRQPQHKQNINDMYQVNRPPMPPQYYPYPPNYPQYGREGAGQGQKKGQEPSWQGYPYPGYYTGYPPLPQDYVPPQVPFGYPPFHPYSVPPHSKQQEHPAQAQSKSPQEQSPPSYNAGFHAESYGQHYGFPPQQGSSSDYVPGGRSSPQGFHDSSSPSAHQPH